MMVFKSLVAVFALAFAAGVQAGSAWDVSTVGSLTVIAQQKGEWGVYFSGNRVDAVFCFVGPMKVVAGEV